MRKVQNDRQILISSMSTQQVTHPSLLLAIQQMIVIIRYVYLHLLSKYTLIALYYMHHQTLHKEK